MSLFNWQDLLDNHQLFLFIDFIENSIPSGNVQPVDDDPAFQDQFLLVPLASRERVFFKPFQGRFDDPPYLSRQAIDLISQFVPEYQRKAQSLISESES